MANESSAQDGAASGAAAGESEESGSKEFVPPKDGSWIPKQRFDEALNAERGRTARLEAEIAALKVAQQQKPKDGEPAKRYTKAELNTAVQAGQITADVADEVWAKQLREDVKRETKQEILGEVQAERRQERVNSDLETYKALAPEILDEGSETRQKIVDEYKYLVTVLGNKQSLETELAATRAVLGPIEKLRTARSARRETETHEETGGSSEGGQSRRAAKTGWDALDTRQKAHYQRQIDTGLYADRKAVEEELKFVRRR